MDKYQEVAKLLKDSRKSMVLTGAGISTESGIPDFRSKGTGLWTKMDPMEALSADVLFSNPKKFYNEGFKILTDMDDIEPNVGHKVLAEMEQEGIIDGVITQNIDNLHHKAGSRNIYEVHGQIRTVHCMSCQKTYPFQVMKDKVDAGEVPPKCDDCGGMMRTDVVLFGDQMPSVFNEAMQELEDTDLLIVIGSSLMVSPVNFMPRLVKDLVIINRDPTGGDSQAKVIIRESIGKTMEAIYDAYKELS